MDITLVYALLYDIGDGAAEISGIYNTLKSAQQAISIQDEWKTHKDKPGFWEAIDLNNSFWYIEAHALQN
jgi:hypothetical protein